MAPKGLPLGTDHARVARFERWDGGTNMMTWTNKWSDLARRPVWLAPQESLNAARTGPAPPLPRAHMRRRGPGTGRVGLPPVPERTRSPDTRRQALHFSQPALVALVSLLLVYCCCLFVLDCSRCLGIQCGAGRVALFWRSVELFRWGNGGVRRRAMPDSQGKARQEQDGEG